MGLCGGLDGFRLCRRNGWAKGGVRIHSRQVASCTQRVFSTMPSLPRLSADSKMKIESNDGNQQGSSNERRKNDEVPSSGHTQL